MHACRRACVAPAAIVKRPRARFDARRLSLVLHGRRGCALGAAQVRARSDTDADNELLSVVLAKGGRKAVVGSGAGDLGLFTWGEFDDFSDSFPGAPPSAARRALHQLPMLHEPVTSACC